MIVEPRIASNVRQLAATSGDIRSIWLCGSRANGGAAAASADWDLVIFGSRSAAEALEQSSSFLGQDVDLLFVDVASGRFKRLGSADGWEDFASWRWTERAPGEAEYQCTRQSDQLVMLNGEWVEAGTLEVVRRKAFRLWPQAPVPEEPFVH
jgi:hypothetical protein